MHKAYWKVEVIFEAEAKVEEEGRPKYKIHGIWRNILYLRNKVQNFLLPFYKLKLNVPEQI